MPIILLVRGGDVVVEGHYKDYPDTAIFRWTRHKCDTILVDRMSQKGLWTKLLCFESEPNK